MNLHRTIYYLLTKPNAFRFPLTPFIRFIYWQLSYRLGKKDILFNLPTGTQIQLKPHQVGLSNFYYYGLPDYKEQKFLINHLGKDDLFIDVGANVGGWSMLAAGTGARVIAIEPVPATYQSLKENIEISKVNTVQSYQLGLSDSEGSLFFSVDKDAENKVVNKDYNGLKSKIRVTTLDSLLDEQKPAIIKIDVEGHELAVLHGSNKILQTEKLKALIIETFRSKENLEKIKKVDNFLEKFGFIPVD